jgi:hypothetical protein
MRVTWDSPFSAVAGKASREVKKLPFETVGDLLGHYPRAYVAKGSLSDLGELTEGDYVSMIGRIVHNSSHSYRDRRTGRPAYRLEIKVEAEDGTLRMTFFDQKKHIHDWRQEHLAVGRFGMFSGRLKWFRHEWELNNPDCRVYDGSGVGGEIIPMPELIPIYRTFGKVTSWQIEEVVGLALQLVDDVPDPLPPAVREEHGFLPALGEVPDDVWDRAALVWLNSPNNPTGAVAPLSFLERLASLARAHGFVFASDEAYTELWFDEPPPSALQLDDLTNVVAFNTLSKRSSMTGFRSGFVAGDPELVDALRRFRPNVGTAPQEFVQRASVVAGGDEVHVERARDAYRRKRELLLGALRGRGLRDAGGPATMYLWIAVPVGETSEGHAARLLEHGVLVTPGPYLGPSGEGYVRYALVATEEECARAAAILEEVL